jgi:hypothetical protein
VPVEDRLADFSTSSRVLLLSVMALVIGAFSALVAYVLIWLIAAITNLAFYDQFSAAPALPQGNHLGYLFADFSPLGGGSAPQTFNARAAQPLQNPADQIHADAGTGVLKVGNAEVSRLAFNGRFD